MSAPQKLAKHSPDDFHVELSVPALVAILICGLLMGYHFWFLLDAPKLRTLIAAWCAILVVSPLCVIGFVCGMVLRRSFCTLTSEGFVVQGLRKNVTIPWEDIQSVYIAERFQDRIGRLWIKIRPEFFERSDKPLKGTLAAAQKQLGISTAIMKVGNVELRDIIMRYLHVYRKAVD